MNVRLALLIGLSPALAAAQPANRSNATATAPEIVATGSAEVQLPPDRARLSVSILIRNASATEAGRLNAERMASVLAALRRLRIADSSLATTGFSIAVEEQPFDAPALPVDAPPV